MEWGVGCGNIRDQTPIYGGVREDFPEEVATKTWRMCNIYPNEAKEGNPT